MEEIFYPSSDGKTNVHACIWRPEGAPKGVVQIIHGMAEYAARYAPFAQFLAQNGYVVCAEDHLGHGQSVTSADNLGWFNEGHDYKLVLADIRTLHQKTAGQFPGVPYFVLGHSMGSFFCRNYIALYGSELSGAVVMGTGFKGKLLLNTALFVTRLNALFCGWKNRSKFVKSLAFGSYNKRFKAENEGNAWLSVDRENIQRYNADPLCGFDFTDNGYYVLFSVIKAACSGKTIKSVPKDLPVFFIAGGNDPVGDYGKGVLKASQKFKKAGVKEVTCHILPDGERHEILNDKSKDKVFEELLAFFNGHLPA